MGENRRKEVAGEQNMSKEEFVELLNSKGIEAKIQDGVVMILYGAEPSSPTAVYKKFNLAKKFAEENGYKSSIGIRKKVGEDKTVDTDFGESYEQMNLFQNGNS